MPITTGIGRLEREGRIRRDEKVRRRVRLIRDRNPHLDDLAFMPALTRLARLQTLQDFLYAAVKDRLRNEGITAETLSAMEVLRRYGDSAARQEAELSISPATRWRADRAPSLVSVLADHADALPSPTASARPDDNG